MTPIAEALAKVTIGQPQNVGRLTVFPLLGSSDGKPPYLLLDEALAKGVAKVTETSTSGSVPELRFENRSDQLHPSAGPIGHTDSRVLRRTRAMVVPPAGLWLVGPRAVQQKPCAESLGCERFAQSVRTRALRSTSHLDRHCPEVQAHGCSIALAGDGRVVRERTSRIGEY